MKHLLLSLTCITLTIFYSSCTEEKNTPLTCNNGIKDGSETEIDCGGGCSDCPQAGFLSCTLGTSYFGCGSPGGQIFNPNIRIYGVDAKGRPLNFMFIPDALNTPLRINAESFSYNGEPYTKGSADSGEVVLTALDTVRKIASGTFWFSGRRITNPEGTLVTNGVFTNVRYSH